MIECIFAIAIYIGLPAIAWIYGGWVAGTVVTFAFIGIPLLSWLSESNEERRAVRRDAARGVSHDELCSRYALHPTTLRRILKVRA